MTENFLQILLYLFQHHVIEGVLQQKDREGLVAELDSVGFSSLEARYAIEWLDGFSQTENAIDFVSSPSNDGLRAFTRSETLKLDTCVRGFIFFLQQHDLLDELKRELIIERAMALQTHRVNLYDLYYIVNMLLANSKPEDEATNQAYQLLMVNTGIKH